MIGARSRPPGPLLCVWFRFHSLADYLRRAVSWPASLMLVKKIPLRVADYRRGIFLFWGKVAADQGRNGPDQRQQSTQSGALPATDNSQPTNRSTSRPEGAGGRNRRQLTGRRRRQSRRPERPSRPDRRPAKDTSRPADQPPDTTGARHTTSNSKHKKHHRFTKMRRGGRPAQGGTPATVGPRWPGYRQARPPQGRRSRLRGACLGLAGRQTGRHNPPAGGVPRAPPRAKRGEGGACRRQCARRS